jgi:choline dehydrogenase-like flavoprotein
VFRVFSSSGTVTLCSDDPTVDPAVAFDMLSDGRDLMRLRLVFRELVALARHPAIEAITESVSAAQPLHFLFSPLEDLRTDDQIDEWLLRSCGDEFHAAGTCRMGTPGDPAAVVDTSCRVIGYDGLRVCDASVMPDLPRANPNLTVLAVAQRLVWAMTDQELTSVVP